MLIIQCKRIFDIVNGKIYWNQDVEITFMNITYEMHGNDILLSIRHEY